VWPEALRLLRMALEEWAGSVLVDTRQAGLLADLGVRAYYEGYAAWMLGNGVDGLIDSVDEELAAYEMALRRLDDEPAQALRHLEGLNAARGLT